MKAFGLWHKLFLIAAPIALQNLVFSSINFADVFMIGKLGPANIAGAGIANQIYFLFCLTLFGINSGAAIFIAQFWGQGQHGSIHKSIGLALTLSQGAALLFFCFAFFSPGRLIVLYSPDPEVISAGASYLKIVSTSYFVTAFSFSLSIALRAIARPFVSLYSSLLSLAVNVFFNYTLIFGHWGFPKLGLPGAAIATVIARTLEVGLLFLLIRRHHLPVWAPLKEMLSFRRPFVIKVLAVSIPVMLNEIFWSVGITFYNVIYARMGTLAIASVQIENSIERIAFVFFVGIGAATATLVGHSIGEGYWKKTRIIAAKLARFSFLSGAFLGGVLVLAAPALIGLFDISSLVRENAVFLLRLYGFILPFRAYNVINVIGVFRGGGDTKYCLFVDLAALWLVGLPAAFTAGLILKLSLPVVFLCAGLEEIIKSFLVFYRHRSGKWIHSLSSPE